MSKAILLEQRRVLPPDRHRSVSLLGMDLDSMLNLDHDDFRFEIEDDDGEFMVRIVVTRGGEYLNHTRARLKQVPVITNYLATTGKIKEAFEKFRDEKLSEIEDARSQLAIWSVL